MAQTAEGSVDGLTLRIEDLGLGHDFDDDSGHGGNSSIGRLRGTIPDRPGLTGRSYPPLVAGPNAHAAPTSATGDHS
ncbi:hypothetical protein GCM10009832_17260 [Dietzia kunjamensis subsp. schimae]